MPGVHRLVSHYTDTHLYVFSLALVLPLIINNNPDFACIDNRDSSSNRHPPCPYDDTSHMHTGPLVITSNLRLWLSTRKTSKVKKHIKDKSSWTVYPVHLLVTPCDRDKNDKLKVHGVYLTVYQRKSLASRRVNALPRQHSSDTTRTRQKSLSPRMLNAHPRPSSLTARLPIRDKTTTEPTSTDLDCIKNRLWGVHCPVCEPLFTYGIYTCILVFQGSRRFMKKTQTKFNIQTLSNNNQDNSVSKFSVSLSFTFGHPTSSKSLASKSTSSPSSLPQSSSVTSVTSQISPSSPEPSSSSVSSSSPGSSSRMIDTT